MKKVIVVGLIVIAIIIFIDACRMCRSDVRLVNEVDTTINYLRIDSIEYNIIRRDTIIYNIKIKERYEIEKAKSLSDSDAVELFKRLVTE